MVSAFSQLSLRQLSAFSGVSVSGTKIIPAAQLDKWREAKSILAAAHQESEKIVSQAHAAYEVERQRGYAEGRETAWLEQATQSMENIGRNIEFLEKSESLIVDLVMQAVRKVLKEFDDQEKIISTVKNVLALARDQKRVTLRLNPVQLNEVKGRLQELRDIFPSLGTIDLVSESQVDRGVCILETEIGSIEASIETQLAAIEAAFDKTLGRNGLVG